MSVQLGTVAPDFKAVTTAGAIQFHDWLGDSWGILFSHPADFTPVCTTELGTVARLKPEFDKRNVKPIGLSVDPIADHHEWLPDIESTQGVAVNFPIIADEDGEIAQAYGMIHPEADDTFTVRSVYIIDPNKKIRLILTYPAAVGRNFDEILRALDALQLGDQYRIVTPANWQDGQDVIVNTQVSDDEADKLFPKGYETVLPYLRVTPQPDK